MISLLQDNRKIDEIMNNDSIDRYPTRQHFKKAMRRTRRRIQWRCFRVMRLLHSVVETRDEMETFLFKGDTPVRYSPFHYACNKKYAMLATEMLRYNTRDDMLHETTSGGRSALVICAMMRTSHMDRVFRLILRKTRDDAYLFHKTTGTETTVLNLCLLRKKKSRVLSILRSTRNEDNFYLPGNPPWFNTWFNNTIHVAADRHAMNGGEIIQHNNRLLLTMMYKINMFAAVRYILERCAKLKHFENSRLFISYYPIHRVVLIGLRSLKAKCERMRAILEWKLAKCVGTHLNGDVLRVVAEFCGGSRTKNTIDYLQSVFELDAIQRIQDEESESLEE
jgi:hypothetical protein